MSQPPQRAAEGSLSRRSFLGAGGLCLGLCQATAAAPATERRQPFARYSDLLDAIRQRGHSWRVLGAAPDQSPLVAVKTGGTKQPAVFITAGSHSTEHAGVFAAVELIDRLQTEHEVWVLPARDPIGLSGYAHALSLGLGHRPELDSLEAAESLLRRQGEVLHDSGDTLLAVIGDYGYANRDLYRRVEQAAPYLEPLKGRRIYFPSRAQDMPAAGPLERAYTLVVTPDGEVLHLNRFHDTSWAPAEVRCTRRLMSEIKPALTLDLHEHGRGGFFWMSARRQRTGDDEIWERRIAAEAIGAVAAGGALLADDDFSPGSFFARLQQGVYWLDAQQRGEGLNLVDFAARRYGPAFTIETGMRGPFSQRVEQHLLVARTAVKVFEQRYA